jgi:hypothetical protein
MWPFGRSSGAEFKTEVVKTAGVPFPLTPALSPRRGRNIRPCFDNTIEFDCRMPPKRKTKKWGPATAKSEFSSGVPAFLLSWGRGLG